MNAKTDVVVVFYEHWKTLPVCVEGLKDNLDRIEKVFFVVDGELDESALNTLRGAVTGLPAQVVMCPKNGHGVARNLNRAAKELVTTPYMLVTTAKQRMIPGYIEEMLCRAGADKIVLAPIHGVLDWPDGALSHPDASTVKFSVVEMLRRGRGWLICRNGATLFPVEKYLAIGGHDERFCELGYGLEDYEFGCRWLQEGGTIVWTNGTHSRRPVDLRPINDRVEKQIQEGNSTILLQSAFKLFGGRAFLFADGRPLNDTYLHIGHDNSRADVVADCEKLEWMLDGSANSLHMIPSSYLLNLNYLIYMPVLYRKLAPGGSVTFWGDMASQVQYPAELCGFVVDVFETRVECYKPSEDEE